MTVSVRQAQMQLAELIDRSAAGEEVVITRDGQAVARLIPNASAATPAKSVLEQLAAIPARQHSRDEWEQIGRSLQQERNSWDR